MVAGVALLCFGKSKLYSAIGTADVVTGFGEIALSGADHFSSSVAAFQIVGIAAGDDQSTMGQVPTGQAHLFAFYGVTLSTWDWLVGAPWCSGHGVTHVALSCVAIFNSSWLCRLLASGRVIRAARWSCGFI